MELTAEPEITIIKSGDKIDSKTYTGKLNICLDCEYYTTIDRGAEVHSREKKHFVFQDMVRELPTTKEAVQTRRDYLKNTKRD